jgi:hypothetical protein
MGTSKIQGELWGKVPGDWAELESSLSGWASA